MSENVNRDSVGSHCYAMGRPDDGSFTIHVNGELRGKYANAETLHVHAAEMMREIARLQEVVKDQQRQIQDKCDECAGLAHVIIESGFTPGVDSPCRCDECKTVCKGMAEAGYMTREKDWWWDDSDE